MEMVLCIDIEKLEKYKLLCKLFVIYLVEFKLWAKLFYNQYRPYTS